MKDEVHIFGFVLEHKNLEGRFLLNEKNKYVSALLEF